MASDKFKSKFERANGSVIEGAGQSYEYETYSLPFIQTRAYTPDFRLENGIFVETKGYFDSADRSKLKLIKKQYPDIDLRLVFQTPHKLISKKSKSTYIDWAEKNGFKWAEKEIPKEWLDEERKDVNDKYSGFRRSKSSQDESD